MKKSGLFAASVAAVSASAMSASSTNFVCNSNLQVSHEDVSLKKDHDNSSMQRSSSTEKFAPRFDGLRFIETLVTAHR
ncbi:uncharacterized protein LOC116111357 [Pistacia vera]|uniref:uncharacterized protein LOC116111357 n=1 Tax=Pistacia vera TaxID=55513 RepID=UPI001262FF73|nr:uncharacterized protein LOC116111357 [Pistacia vera]